MFGREDLFARGLKEGKKKPKKILIFAGGTGGHVMPALAVAQYLQQQHAVLIHWVGTRAGIEAKLVPHHQIPLSYVNLQGIRGKSWHSSWRAPWRILKAFVRSLFILLKERPHAVLSMGGYAAGPGSLAACLLRCPLLVHEQNTVPGWTNRLLAPFARYIMVGFPNTFSQFSNKVFVTGNPVRANITLKSKTTKTFNRSLNVLVLGGSQGARKINQLMPQVMTLLPSTIRVWHQTGEADCEATKQCYRSLGRAAQVSAFIDDMGAAYAWADVVICRSGALTIAELALVGVASILIPFPYATQDHQLHNAKYLSEQQAAVLLLESECTPERLASILLHMQAHPQQYVEMAKASYALAKPQATEKVAQLCLEVCK